MKNILLNDGNAIPAIGFGVYMIPNDGSTYNASKKRCESAIAILIRLPPILTKPK